MEKQVIPEEVIENKIFLVQGQKCMLGNHLAKLYHVSTSALMQAVKRNNERFPDDFMFELNRDEITRISQIVTSLKYSKNVYAFTEQGVAMLSSVLRSKRAIQVNIAIRFQAKMQQSGISLKPSANLWLFPKLQSAASVFTRINTKEE